MSVRLHISKTTRRNFAKFSAHVTCGVARSSADDSAICYVLPVLRMTSGLPIIGQAKATPIGPIFKVTHQGAAPRTKSDVYDCLVINCVYIT